ncbi:MAG TPA: hypothetical protein VGF53_11675 [Pseudolabrys sp.]|jgi:hypothetical protein
MADEAATDRITRDLREAIETMRSDLDRVELLAAALNIFSVPVPDYEPRLRYPHRAPLSRYELRNTDRSG